MRPLTVAIALFVSLAVPGALSGQTIPLTKGTIVTAKIPVSLLREDGVLLSGGGGAIYAAEISQAPQGVAVGGTNEWALSGFPSMLEGRIEKITRKKEFTELEIRGEKGV